MTTYPKVKSPQTSALSIEEKEKIIANMSPEERTARIYELEQEISLLRKARDGEKRTESEAFVGRFFRVRDEESDFDFLYAVIDGPRQLWDEFHSFFRPDLVTALVIDNEQLSLPLEKRHEAYYPIGVEHVCIDEFDEKNCTEITREEFEAAISIKTEMLKSLF